MNKKLILLSVCLFSISVFATSMAVGRDNDLGAPLAAKDDDAPPAAEDDGQDIFADDNPGITVEAVEGAIERGVAFLLSQQLEDGSFGTQHKVGLTALATFALAYAVDDSMAIATQAKTAMDLAAQYLVANPSTQTYDASLRAQALNELDPVAYRAAIEASVRQLEANQYPHGMWSYGPYSEEQLREALAGGQNAPETAREGQREGRGNREGERAQPTQQADLPGDNSNTQFAVLGLQAGIEAGVAVDQEVQNRALAHFYSTQVRDGSWGYRQRSSRGTGSMTCAGLSSLFVLGGANQAAGAGPVLGPNPFAGTQADLGLGWLAEHFEVERGANVSANWNYYYLYSMERVGILSGLRSFGDHEWYFEGAGYILEKQDPQGFWCSTADAGTDFAKTHDTSFALLFLGRANAPVLVKELRWENDWWNPGPSTIVPVIAELEEAGIVPDAHFQYANASEANLRELLEAPVCYVTGHNGPVFSETQIELMRAYVENGGTILAEPQDDSVEFVRNFRALAAHMFPERRMRAFESSDPIYEGPSALRGDARGTLVGISDEFRPLIVMSRTSLSSDESKSPIGRAILTNAISYVAKSGGVWHRLAPPMPIDAPVASGNSKNVARLDLANHAETNHRDLEHLVTLLNASGHSFGVAKENVAASSPRVGEFDALYLASNDELQLTPEETENLTRYVRAGGKLIVFGSGGSWEFQRSAQAILPRIAGTSWRNIEREGDLRALVPTLEFRGIDSRDSRLRGFYPRGLEVDGKLAIVFCEFDLARALEGHPSPGCVGIVPADAEVYATRLVEVLFGIYGASSRPDNPVAPTPSTPSGR
ncbi:MAG: DUF4159 domain-containing protein [Planctomycetes bacterium]|nr:DUF4159 domain-containing protein [Planctomycetota bacterium]